VKRRLLVIDDEPIIRDLMVEILADAGYDVLAAETAARALELLTTDDVALVISDIMMPGLSGLDLLQTLNQTRPSLPVILVTGAGTYDHLRSALARGAAGLVLKPFSHAELHAAVADTLRRSDRSERELRERLLTPTLASSLANAIEARDGPTHGHCERLAAIAVRIGERLRLEPAEIETLRMGAILHDIGKIGMSDRILLKPGPLNPDELALMRTHPQIGDRLLEPLDLLERARPIVLHHHERWDGLGYPDGLAGEEIPLFARIVGVADAAEAMASERPYREALSEEAILDELRAGRGTQWDPELVDLLLELVSLGEVGFAGDGANVSAGRVAA